MLNDDIKKQVRDIINTDSELEIKEETISKSEATYMPDDAKALWDTAMEKELLRREGTLEENERKYDAAIVITYADKDGNIEKRIIVSETRWEDGEVYTKFNAFGYDRLPPDLQEMYGNREDVVENYILQTDDMIVKHDAFIDYTENNEGHETWEEYRDAKGLGPKEEFTIKKAQDVDDNSPPKETPAVDQDIENLITK